jgi:hypothetical protein
MFNPYLDELSQVPFVSSQSLIDVMTAHPKCSGHRQVIEKAMVVFRIFVVETSSNAFAVVSFQTVESRQVAPACKGGFTQLEASWGQ